MLLFHAGMAAKAAGRPTSARAWLGAALRPNSRFSPVHASQARRALRDLTV